MPWITPGGDRRDRFDDMAGELPDLAAPYFALQRSLWDQSHLPVEILELCRLRLAQLHRCDVEVARTELDILKEKRDALTQWEQSELFSAADRACLAFAEVYAMDAQALTDEHAGAVKEHFGDAGLVLLVEALGIFDGRTRVSLLWQLQPEAAS